MVFVNLPMLALVGGCGLSRLTSAGIVLKDKGGLCELTNDGNGTWVWPL